MHRQLTRALLAAGTALAISALAALPAAAAASGAETSSGILVTSGVSGTRMVISSVVVAEGVFTGGTGRFAATSGSGTGTVSGQGLLPRNPDGSCSFTQAALHEEDVFTDSGTLSFRGQSTSRERGEPCDVWS